MRKLSPNKEITAMARRLMSIRIHRGVNRDKMAKTLNISVQQYGYYERGENAMTVHAVQKIAKALGVNPCEICGCCNDG